MELGLLDTALIYFDKAYRQASRADSDKAYRQVSRADSNKADKQALRADSDKADKQTSVVDICINLSDCYYLKGDYPLAGQYYRRALFMADSLGMGERFYFPIFLGMAKLYQDLDNFTLAEQYYERVALYSGNMAHRENFFFEDSRGNFYYLAKEYEKARQCFLRADRLAERMSLSIPQAIARTNLGEIHLLLENVDSARFYLNHAKELLGELFFQPIYNFYLTGLYASLAMLEGDLSEAEKLLVQPYDTLAISPQYIYYRNKRMQDLYFRKQDFKKAYFYQSEAETYNDSIRSVKVRNSIAEIDARYSQDTTLLKKDLQIALVQNEALQWKSTTIVGFVLFTLILLLVAGVVFYYLQRNKLRQMKQVSTITALRMENIRNRLSPHFMFNALNMVMPSFGKYKELENPFRMLIQLLRDNLVASDQMAVPLKQEIERVQNFLRFHALKQTESVRTEWDLSPDVSTEILVPSMSIQIPVENAIKYAFLPDYVDAQLQILIKPETDAISITIDDNGVGYNPDRQPDRQQGTGSGLKMLRRTIELLNANNNRQITFKIENKNTDVPPGQGTRVLLFIPVNYNFNL